MADGEIIYLDNNATTQLDPAVVEEMLPFLTKYYGNPSSGYGFAAEARRAVDLARERMAALLGCEPSEIVFTSGGTESNNAVINSALQFEPRAKHVITSAVEHSAVLRPCQDLTKRGCKVTILGVDRDGNVDLGKLEAAILPETALVLGRSPCTCGIPRSISFPFPRTRFTGQKASAHFMSIGERAFVRCSLVELRKMGAAVEQKTSHRLSVLEKRPSAPPNICRRGKRMFARCAIDLKKQSLKR